MLKFKISGVYRTGQAHDADKVDFDGVEVLMPKCDLANVNSHILYRVGADAIKNDPRYASKRVQVIEQFFFVGKETGEEVQIANPIAGKKLKDLDWLGMQYFAIQYNLREIPLINACSLREAKEKAYKLYYDKILNRDLGEGITYDELPPIDIPEEAQVMAKIDAIVSNDDVINATNQNDKAQEMSLEELKALAKQKGIDFSYNISYAKLYAKVFA